MLRGKSGRLSRSTELGVYGAAAVTYIAAGFIRQEVFAWWSYGAIWFVAWVWFVPPLINRVLGHASVDDNESPSDATEAESSAK